MCSTSFTSSFVLLLHSAVPGAALGPQYPAVYGWTGRKSPNLVQNEVLLLCFLPAFPTMNAPLHKGSSPALGTVCPLNYNHTRKFLLQRTHCTQRQSQICLVASRLYILLVVRARKCKVRAGEHKCKAGSQMETQLPDRNKCNLEFPQETKNCPLLSFVQGGKRLNPVCLIKILSNTLT